MMYILLLLTTFSLYFIVMHKPRLDKTSEGDLLLWLYNRNYERVFIVLIKNKR
jgi:hypothetical protein